MLKSLHKNDTQITPFVATKDWELTNVTNEDLILMEHSGSDGGPVAVEYINYGSESISLNYACSIAKEQQSKDRAVSRTGLRIDGIFYPDSEPQNLDGTYKRIIYSQTKGAFYNNYRDPTKMWGMENVDFDLSKTEKYLSDQIQVIDIPQIIFGEKVLEHSVVMFNTNLDNDYSIVDDGHNNLYAVKNLFARQQELGDFHNIFTTGSDFACETYFSLEPRGPITLIVHSASAALSWSCQFVNEVGWFIERYDNKIPPFFLLATKPTNSLRSYEDETVSVGNTYTYRVWAWNEFGTSSYSNTASIYFPPQFPDTSSFDIGVFSGSMTEEAIIEETSFDLGATSGSIISIIVPVTGSDTILGGVDATPLDAAVTTVFGSVNQAPPAGIDTASFIDVGAVSGSRLTVVIEMVMVPDTMSFMDAGFYTGSVVNTILTMSMIPDTMSFMDAGFFTGSVITTILTHSMVPDTMSFMDAGFYTGSLSTWVTESYQNQSASFDVGAWSGSVQ